MSTNPLLYKIDDVPSPVTQTVNVKMTMTNGFQSVSITSNPVIPTLTAFICHSLLKAIT